MRRDTEPTRPRVPGTLRRRFRAAVETQAQRILRRRPVVGEHAEGIQQSMSMRPAPAPVGDMDVGMFHGLDEASGMPGSHQNRVRPNAPAVSGLADCLDIGAQVHDLRRRRAGPGAPGSAAKLVARDGPLCGPQRVGQPTHRPQEEPVGQEPVRPAKVPGDGNTACAGHHCEPGHSPQDRSNCALIEFG